MTDSQYLSARKLVAAGLPSLFVSLLGITIARSLLAALYGHPLSLLALPGSGFESQLFPEFTVGAFDVEAWLHEWFTRIYELCVVMGYYVAAILTIVSAFTVLVGMLVARDPWLVGRVLWKTAHDRRIQALAAVQVVLWLAVFNQWLLNIIIQVSIVVVVALTAFLVAGTGLIALSDRVGPVATVVVVHPLWGLAFVFPPIASALASPAFRDLAQAVTFDVAVWMLVTVFRPLGAQRALQEYFELEGSGFVLLWVALIVAVGWVVGTARYLNGSLSDPDEPGRLERLYARLRHL